jgi:Fe-Mn family superoxide dismutase
MLKTLTLSAAAGALALSGGAFAQTNYGAETYPFGLPDLPYATDALAPAIDAETMEIHHGRHHNAYVNNLNSAVEGDEDLQGLTLRELIENASERSDAIRNNGGGHWNHAFFWDSMTAPGTGGEPSEDFANAIDDAFGSMDAFKSEFEAAGAGQFGSGWAWLIVDENGDLVVTSTPNQDNPLMDVADEQGTPILGNDVWEHAYYITYRNARGEYLSAWWDVVDWNVASERYAAATMQD